MATELALPTFVSRNAIRLVLFSIAVNAVIGIVAILSGDFSDLDAKILVTSLSLTGGSVLAFASLAGRSDRFLPYVPEAGAASAVVGFGLLVYGVWNEFDGENVAKAAGTAILFASGIAHAGLLSRSRLAPRFMPVLWTAWVLAAVLVGMITFLIWASDAVDGDVYARVMGVVIVLLAAATLSVPVMHRASRDELRKATAVSGEPDRSVRFCPNCGSGEIQSPGEGYQCSHCGARFSASFSAEKL